MLLRMDIGIVAALHNKLLDGNRRDGTRHASQGKVMAKSSKAAAKSATIYDQKLACEPCFGFRPKASALVRVLGEKVGFQIRSLSQRIVVSIGVI